MLLLDVVPNVLLPTLHKSSLRLLDLSSINAFRVDSSRSHGSTLRLVHYISLALCLIEALGDLVTGSAERMAQLSSTDWVSLCFDQRSSCLVQLQSIWIDEWVTAISSLLAEVSYKVAKEKAISDKVHKISRSNQNDWLTWVPHSSRIRIIGIVLKKLGQQLLRLGHLWHIVWTVCVGGQCSSICQGVVELHLLQVWRLLYYPIALVFLHSVDVLVDRCGVCFDFCSLLQPYFL